MTRNAQHATRALPVEPGSVEVVFGIRYETSKPLILILRFMLCSPGIKVLTNSDDPIFYTVYTARTYSSFDGREVRLN